MNACSRAAYNGNLIIKDYRINKTFNFSQNKTNIYHEVLLSEIVDKKYLDIEVLMNKVENSEKRKDSQLLREYTLALPREEEVSLRHKIALTKLFVRKIGLVREKLAVVIDIHKPQENDVNSYSKILATTRRFVEDGKMLGKKARDLDIPIRSEKGKKFVPNKLLINNGEIWKDIQNRFFECCGMNIRVDDVGDIPQEHMGIRKYGILAEQKRLNKQDI